MCLSQSDHYFLYWCFIFSLCRDLKYLNWFNSSSRFPFIHVLVYGLWTWLDAVNEDLAFVRADFHSISCSCSLSGSCRRSPSLPHIRPISSSNSNKDFCIILSSMDMLNNIGNIGRPCRSPTHHSKISNLVSLQWSFCNTMTGWPQTVSCVVFFF